ncbi:MAG: radical SAM protein, partial [Dehalococcoidales bacterium]
EEDIIGAVGKVAEQGIRQLKLYLMVGLPTETDEDIEAIVRLAVKCKGVLDRWRGGTRLSINIAPFVPKAGTPFQWLPMAGTAILKGRISRLSKVLSPRGIKVKSESPAWSQVQGVLARGDSALAGVLADVSEVSLSGWRRAVAGRNLDIDYIHRRWPAQQKLPWSAVDMGLKKGRLEAELDKALAE